MSKKTVETEPFVHVLNAWCAAVMVVLCVLVVVMLAILKGGGVP